ncbi:hypothetical protein KC331_g4066 [Hortaea werneckii]|nr:hypothetical protein KC331_g4066 [Hortaea werneckii]KAI7714175.1 hypothetical protein KC353_g7000 [Hortaea werneckii]
MAAYNEELLRTGKGADITIRCEGRDFKVHKTFVSRSPVIDRACHNGFLESQNGILPHNEFDADTVERMLEHVYKDNYALPTEPTITVPNLMPVTNGATDKVAILGINARLIIHGRVYAISDYYDLPGLGDLALRRFQEDTQSHSLAGFAYVVREINELVSKDEKRLRGIIQDFCSRNIDDFANNGFFMTALASLPGLQEFTAQLLRKVVQGKGEQKCRLERELEGKDLDIRRMKARRDGKAAHTEEVLQTFIGVMRKLPGCPQGRCGNAHASCLVRRKPDRTYGPGAGYVEVKCGDCKATMSK